MPDATLIVQGMTCQHCVRAVTDAIRGVPGVTDVRVEVGRARVQWAGNTSADDFARAVEAAGYPTTVADGA